MTSTDMIRLICKIYWQSCAIKAIVCGFDLNLIRGPSVGFCKLINQFYV